MADRLFFKDAVSESPSGWHWWFASTCIPLVAATIGPLCNVLSIAALVSPWRVTLPNNGELPGGADDNGVGVSDPHWELILNGVSLACGFAGNFFLLLNFTGGARYIIALPLSIVFWILASGILIAITTALSIHEALSGPGEIYSQGFWHAVMAAILYFAGCIILVVNMVGYFLGHYPQQFDLDDDQRTLILQTMMFFFWLAGGAAVFTALEGWSYSNALYYADVTVLTIGFGDFHPNTNSGRGFLFFYEIFGIIFLGLVISSISRFAANIGADKIIKRHQRHARESTVGRTVTNEDELRERLGLPPRKDSVATTLAMGTSQGESLHKYGHLKITGRTVTFHEKAMHASGGGRGGAARRGTSGSLSTPKTAALSRDAKLAARSAGQSSESKRRQRRHKLLLLEKEKDRFEAMREIQDETQRWKQYWALFMAVTAFGILWFLGALVFMLSESRLLGLSYFQMLYFGFVSLLTIGYGDFSPTSNIGKPFFIVWSLFAVPIVTVLIQNMSSTVVSAINRGTFKLADWTVLPNRGAIRDFVDHHPTLKRYLERRQAHKRVEQGFQVQNPDDVGRDVDGGTNIAPSQREDERGSRTETDAAETPHDLVRQLAKTIKAVAQDLRSSPPKRYKYDEWRHFKKLIRFSAPSSEGGLIEEEEEADLIEWDWIGEDSPMLADVAEAEWVLNRLCESLTRYSRRQALLARRLEKAPDVRDEIAEAGKDDNGSL
ncbi:voltage-gated potassium channel [Coniochaeta ligniaria NRRL 30616]|uniref:Voltage-gated potassium channel n=1 Tax=Coniochaeta ligniaria NRRL 30616 TaxID=1408157 RepID=A0A1J7JFD5_9PEZI|nr:voltage-gated potassium channel [Coniochaeta ligniaria NRRL 30616]